MSGFFYPDLNCTDLFLENWGNLNTEVDDIKEFLFIVRQNCSYARKKQLLNKIHTKTFGGEMT